MMERSRETTLTRMLTDDFSSPRPQETRVLMGDPEFFDVENVINPFMAGNLGQVDKKRARKQWEELRETYRNLGFEVLTADAVPGFPDYVFMANQSFPWLTRQGELRFVLSKMACESRVGEVEHLNAWYTGLGMETVRLPGEAAFEGMGDSCWLPQQWAILGGYGFRTSASAYDALEKLLEVPVHRVQLVHPHFYHLDTCLSAVHSQCALFVPEAFTPAGVQTLHQCFDELIPVPLNEASESLSCNGHSPDGKHFIVQRGAPVTCARVKSAGLEVIEVDTSEFIKSGGSVYCMKLMLP
jgi:N-dimethylarginine dimethylaminohydrolase